MGSTAWTLISQEAYDAVSGIDWDFRDSITNYLTHAIHAYPAKFPPQIPSTFIQTFTTQGATILDPFCGSGTTLVEAVRLARNGIGVDANPLAALIARVKSRRLPTYAREEVVNTLAAAAGQQVWVDLDGPPQLHLFGHNVELHRDELEPRLRELSVISENVDYVFFWFPLQAVAELLWLRELIDAVSSVEAKEFLQVALSAITISVSHQDSETRYTRREKHFRSGDAIRRWTNKAREMLSRLQELEKVSELGAVQVSSADARDLGFLAPDSVDLCVSSPPYPNAFTYNLYHRLRMIWLSIDPLAVKRIEIGSHRDYSRPKNGSDKATFQADMTTVMAELFRVLKSRSLCVMVVGDSIIRGERVDNSVIVDAAARSTGFSPVATIKRKIHLGKKALNPLFGKIKVEHVMVFGKP